jgi:hypothetical protein
VVALVNSSQTIQLTGTAYGILSSYPVINYRDGYFFQNLDEVSTFQYPTSTTGGPLTANEGGPEWDGFVVFGSELSGGPITNVSYDDFSNLNSVVDLGVYFCSSTIYLSLSSFDESVSRITKIVCEHNNNVTVYEPTVRSEIASLVNVFKITPPKSQIIELNFIPGEKYITPYVTGLSVIRLDNSVNTFTLRTSVVQCGVLDLYDTTNIINSQVLDNANQILLTLENKTNNTVYTNILNTDIPFFLLTGGDIINIQPSEIELQPVFELEPVDEFDIGQIIQVAAPVNAIPKPKPNPITPAAAEYYYRGGRGIRMRPLLARLLPGQEFSYSRLDSGLIILSGGAPYFPGLGIAFRVEFRVINT